MDMKENHHETCLIDMTMYEREDPMRLGGISVRILKRDCEQMVVPGEATDKWPWSRI
jgi:hypothetical protein